ncbi:MAG: hypothetical protein QOF74_7735, partial [Caballeronia mineralivorans]|nr:hypothetical protein [Caballeronia mineralivorans]
WKRRQVSNLLRSTHTRLETTHFDSRRLERRLPHERQPAECYRRSDISPDTRSTAPGNRALRIHTPDGTAGQPTVIGHAFPDRRARSAALKRVIPQRLRTAESSARIRSIQIAVIGPRAWMSPGTISESSMATSPRTASDPLMLSGPVTRGPAYAGAKKPKDASRTAPATAPRVSLDGMPFS